MSLDRHNNNNSSCPAGSSGSYPESLAKLSDNRNRQNSDQGTVGSAGAGRVSFDQQSIHPLQLDPDLATTTEEAEDEQDVEMEEREGEGVTMLTNGDDGGKQQQQQQWVTMTTTTTTPKTIANTPVSMALATTSSSVDALTTEEAGRGASLGGNQDLPPIPSAPQPRLQPQQQHVVQKKSSFAAKLRKVFNNSKALPPTPQDDSTPTINSTAIQHKQEMQTQEDIISLVSGDDLFGGSSRAATGAGGATTQAEMVALTDQQQEQHRGSVSSASSVDTTVDVQHRLGNSAFQRRGSNQTETPATSPEATPCGSPTDMSTLNTVMSTATGATNQQPGGSSVVVVVGPIPSHDMDPDSTQHRHALSGSESSSSSSSPSAVDDVETTVSALVVGTMPQVAAPLPTNQTAADITSALQPPPLPAKAGNPTRTVKKRLSFASISSFFSPRNGGSSNNSATDQQEARAKQQRASSVPHIENPLVTVGRQIAGFQRRHSLNDLHDNKASSKISRVGANPWEKDPNALPTAAAGAGHEGTSTGAATGTSTANNRILKPVKKLSLNSVFNKGLRKKKKNAAANALKPESSLPAKPLRSALASRSKIAQPGSEAAAHQHQQAPKVHLVHRPSVVVAGRRRSASIRSQTSSYRRHHRNSFHQHQHHHHGHHGHHHHGQNSHQHTDPFARLAEANHALATLSGHGSDDQTAAAVLRLQQHQQYQEEEFSSQEDLDYCASPSTYDSASGGLPPSLDTQGMHYHHNNQSQEGLPISPTRPTTRLDGSTIDSTALSTPPTPHTQQRNGHPTLSPSSSCRSYSSSSSSSDRVEGSSFRSTSDDVESSSSSCSTKQEPVAPESSHSAAAAAAADPSESSVECSLSSRRNSADHGAVFNPLLPASAARVSVNRIAMESLQSTNTHGDSGSNDGSAHKCTDTETLNNHNNNNLLAGVESASTMSSSSTEVSSTTSASTSSATSNDSSLPAKKSSVTIMNTVAEDAVSEEEAMMQAQLVYIQQKQQQYLVEQQQQPYHVPDMDARAIRSDERRVYYGFKVDARDSEQDQTGVEPVQVPRDARP
ncbi:hypothetical protein EC957_002323 [Mortierella hygrophila]|uniref:Uncharacterized protein n=1 Tax=Mortierella hygrophila TaxID=979708 RepID=A0A9P6K1M2_9FUNG|nr:hypothetical protein EC957_002323 [Mortierella hygrophila]